MKGINFAAALDHLVNGKQSMSRLGWAHDNGTKKITLQKPDKNSMNTDPYFFMTIISPPVEGKTAAESRVPWSPSNADLLAKDWVEVK